jgi:putative Mg2+ transporter-C (MgtC) family protein
VQGVTTAAGLWMVTAIGLAAGAGMFVEAVGATLLGVFALTVLRRFEDKDDASFRRRVSLVLVAQDPAPVLAALTEIGVTIHGVSYERRYDDKARVELSFDARIPKKVGVEKVLDTIEATAEVRRLRVEVPG